MGRQSQKRQTANARRIAEQKRKQAKRQAAAMVQPPDASSHIPGVAASTQATSRAVATRDPGVAVSPLEVVYSILFIFITIQLFVTGVAAIQTRWSDVDFQSRGIEYLAKFTLTALGFLLVLIIQFPRSYWYLQSFDQAAYRAEDHFIKRMTGRLGVIERLLRLVLAALLVVLFKAGPDGWVNRIGYQLGGMMQDMGVPFRQVLVERMFGVEAKIEAGAPVLGAGSPIYGYSVGLAMLLTCWLMWDLTLWLKWQLCNLRHSPLPREVEMSVRDYFGVASGSRAEGGIARGKLGRRSLTAALINAILFMPRLAERLSGIAFCVAAIGFAACGGAISFSIALVLLAAYFGFWIKRMRAASDHVGLLAALRRAAWAPLAPLVEYVWRSDLSPGQISAENEYVLPSPGRLGVASEKKT